MNQNKENLEGIVSKLKEQGINAGEIEKQRIIDEAKKEADAMISKAEGLKKKIIDDANAQAAQTKKNAEIAIAQASRDMIEATKIAMLDYLKAIFGKECSNMFTQKQYLQELTKMVLESISGNKTLKVAPEMQKDMEEFLLKEALKETVTLKPLTNSQAKIEVISTDKKGIQFVLSAEDVKNGLFSLLNKDLIQRINKIQEV
ncbi:MAG TPA: hypothetical protein VEP89_09510 [Draconibacterium sp.]|nr:hypothetical protein [Draconibacterium sp.]